MSRTVKVLRGVWIIMMVALLIMIMENAITGYATILYAVAVLAVAVAEQVLSHRQGV
jgi:hypothetical protein